MIGFLLRRAAWFVLTLLGVVTLAFFLMRAAPGGPFSGERALAPGVEAALRARYHLDWPVWRQYLAYMGPFDWGDRGWIVGNGTHPFGGVLAGDFGPSFKYRDFSVNDVLAQSLPVSLELGLDALPERVPQHDDARGHALGDRSAHEVLTERVEQSRAHQACDVSRHGRAQSHGGQDRVLEIAPAGDREDRDQEHEHEHHQRREHEVGDRNTCRRQQTNPKV